MKKYLKYLIVIPISLVLALVVGWRSYVTAPDIYYNTEPEDAVSVLDQLSFEYGNCELQEDGTIKMLGADPGVAIYGITDEVTTLCVRFSEPIKYTVKCQLYYVPQGVEINEEDSISTYSSNDETEIFFTIDTAVYDYFRLDVDGDYKIEDILISSQVPERVLFDRYEALRNGDFSKVNVDQMAVAFVVFLLEGCLLIWQWGRIRGWFARRMEAYRANRKAFWCGMAVYAGVTALALAIYGGLCAAGIFVPSHQIGLYFFFGGSALGAVIALRRQAGRHPERPFLAVALCMGIALAMILPEATLVSLDDETHYKKSLVLSYCGQAYYTAADDLMFAHMVPNQLTLDCAETNLSSLQALYDEGAVCSVSTQIDSSYLAYIPSACAIWLMRAAGGDYCAVFYAGRIANVLLYSFVLYFAIKRLRGSGLFLGLFAMIPTTFYIASNYSYDGWCAAFIALGTAIFLDEYRHPERPLRWPAMLEMLLIFVIGCIPKAIYFPIMLMLLFMPKEKFASDKQRKRYYIAVIAAAALLLLSFAAPFVFSRGAAYTDARGGEGVSAGRQILFILYHPFSYFVILLRFLIRVYFNPSLFMENTVVYMGYMHGDFPLAIPMLLLMAFVYIAGRPQEHLTLKRPGVWTRLAAVIGFLGAIVLVATSMYVAFTPVGYESVLGCQWRYMMPVLLSMLMVIGPNCICIRKRYAEVNTAVMLIQALLLFCGFWKLAGQYI